MVGRWLSFWDAIVSGAMLVSGRVIPNEPYNDPRCYKVYFFSQVHDGTMGFTIFNSYVRLPGVMIVMIFYEG